MAYFASPMSPVLSHVSSQNIDTNSTKPLVTGQTNYLKNTQDPYAPIRAQVEKPVKLIENVFGRDVKSDPTRKNRDVAASFEPKSFGRDRMMVGSLPYATSPRLKRAPLQRMVAMDTRVPRGEWNEALARAGPWYLRHWQIWDNAPFLPSRGDVALDPRFGINNMRQSTIVERTRGI